MKMVGHQHKLMQEVVFLATIVKQYFDKEFRHSVRLEQAAFLECACGHEIHAVPGVASARSRHSVPLRLEAAIYPNCNAALQALRHPNALLSLRFPNSGTTKDALGGHKVPHPSETFVWAIHRYSKAFG